MPKLQEKIQTESLEDSTLEDLVSKVKAVAKGPQRELFAKIVDNFFEEIEEEYFSPEDLADIQEGLEEIKRGEYLSWEECKRKHGL
jgi:predicted transcriptional regulator